jgi:hypothetical protein
MGADATRGGGRQELPPWAAQGPRAPGPLQVTQRVGCLAVDPDLSPSCQGLGAGVKRDMRAAWQRTVGHGSGEYLYRQ